jgi:hypothetical protein
LRIPLAIRRLLSVHPWLIHPSVADPFSPKVV